MLFDLNGVLGHVNNNIKSFNQHGIYAQGVKPVFEDTTTQVYARPNLQYINYELLLKNKKSLDIGVWSS